MKQPTHYKPEQTYTETFLVVDVDRDAMDIGNRFRAYMTGQGDEDSPIAASAASELPEHVLEWCGENVPVDRESCFAIAPEVLAHEGALPADYTGGGIAIQVHEVPPPRVRRVLKDRAAACADRLNGERRRFSSKLIELRVLGFRIVTRTIMDASVPV